MSPREQIFYPIIYYFYVHWNNLKLERFLMWWRLEYRGESLSITWKGFWNISQPAPTRSNALQSWWMDSLMLLWYPADQFITPAISSPWCPQGKEGSRKNRARDIKRSKTKIISIRLVAISQRHQHLTRPLYDIVMDPVVSGVLLLAPTVKTAGQGVSEWQLIRKNLETKFHLYGIFD